MLDQGEMLASGPARLTGGWVGPEAIRDVLKKKKKSLANNGNRNMDRPERQEVAGGNTNTIRERDMSGAATRCHCLNVAGLCKANCAVSQTCNSLHYHKRQA